MMILASRARAAWWPLAGVLVLAIGLGLESAAPAQEEGSWRGDSLDGSALDGTPGLPESDGQPALQGLPGSSFADRVLALTRGRVQLEGGYTFVRDRYAGVPRSDHLFPDMLLRVGLTERFEVRLGWAGYLGRSYDRDVAGAPGNEVLDPTVGFMLDLFPQRGWLPQAAVSAAVPVTLQGNPLTASSFQPLCRVLYRWDLTDRWGIGGTTGMGLLWDGDDSYSQFEQTASVDYLLTDRLDTFLEWEMLADFGSVDDASQHLLSAGVSYLWTEQFQISWRLGAGLNDPAPDLLSSIRFSLRF